MSDIERAVERLSRELNSLRKQVRTQGRASQAAMRSVETADGTVVYYDEQGNEVFAIGEADDGAYGVIELDPTEMPTPTPPDIDERPGAIAIIHDGTFVDHSTPSNLAYFEIHRSPTPDFFASDETQIGTFASPQGGVFLMPAEYADGTYYFAIQAVSRSGVESDKSDEVTGRGAVYPTDSGPTVIPGSSPTLTAAGNAASIVVRATNIQPGEEIEYYISTVDGFVPGPASLFATTQATVVVFDKLPGTTTQLLANQQYFFTARTKNVIGPAAAFSPQISAKLDPTQLTSYWMSELVAGFILAGKIQVGQAYIDANEGIVIPQPDGGVISFPVNGDFAQITAKLIARSLNVTDNLSIYGTNNQVFGQVTLAEGIVKPQVPPSLSGVNRIYETNNGSSLPNVFQGWMEDPADGTAWIQPFAFFAAGVRRHRKSDLGFLGDMTISGVPAAISDFQPFGGMIYSPATARYVMFGTATDSVTGVRWYLVSFSRTGTTLTYTGRLDVASYASFPNQPRVAFDAATGDGWIVYMSDNADMKLRMIRFDPTSVPTRDSSLVPYATALPSKYDIGGVYIGNGDFGAKRWIIQTKASVMYAFSGTGTASGFTRQANDEFTRVGSVMGLAWDGTRFWSYANNGNVNKYSTNKAPAGRTTVPIQARHTWYDNAGVVHETDGGPIETMNLPARQWLRIESDPAPDTDGDPLDLEKADTIRMYASTDGVTLPRLQTPDNWSAMATPTVLRKKTRTIVVGATVGEDSVSATVFDTFVQDDVGGTITGTGIPVGALITSVNANGTRAFFSGGTITVGGTPNATITPVVSTRVGLFESISNAASAPPGVNGFALVGRAPGSYKSTRTDVNGPLIFLKGDGSGRIGPWQFDNLGKTMNDFGPERPGTIIAWPSPNVPLDCAACDGQAVKRPAGIVGGNGAAANPLANNAASDVAPYIRLWQLFGTLHGAGDGSTTFNLPDVQRRVIVGAGGTIAVGRNDGVVTVNSRTFAHNHTVPQHDHGTGAMVLTKNPRGTTGVAAPQAVTDITGSTGMSAAGQNTGNSVFDDIPNYAMRIIIKL